MRDRRLFCIGNSLSVPADMRTPTDWAWVWRDHARFWLRHAAWQDAVLASEVFPAELLRRLRRDESWEAVVWARAWWTLRDFVRIAQLIRSPAEVVIVQGGMPDVRPNDFSYHARRLVNLAPLGVHRWATRVEAEKSARGALRFPQGWSSRDESRRLLIRLFDEVRSRGVAQVFFLLDSSASDDLQELLPGIREGLAEFGRMVREVALSFDAEVLDVADLSAGDPAFHESDTVHWSVHGHQAIAGALASRLQRRMGVVAG